TGNAGRHRAVDGDARGGAGVSTSIVRNRDAAASGYCAAKDQSQGSTAQSATRSVECDAATPGEIAGEALRRVKVGGIARNTAVRLDGGAGIRRDVDGAACCEFGEGDGTCVGSDSSETLNDTGVRLKGDVATVRGRHVAIQDNASSAADGVQLN